jgi:hypothetical protein
VESGETHRRLDPARSYQWSSSTTCTRTRRDLGSSVPADEHSWPPGVARTADGEPPCCSRAAVVDSAVTRIGEQQCRCCGRHGTCQGCKIDEKNFLSPITLAICIKILSPILRSIIFQKCKAITITIKNR